MSTESNTPVNFRQSKKTLGLNNKPCRYYLGERYPGVYFNQQEAKCMFYFLSGYKNKKIAELMSLSSKTVGFYCFRMRHKVPCQSKADLISLVKNTDFLKNYSSK